MPSQPVHKSLYQFLGQIKKSPFFPHLLRSTQRGTLTPRSFGLLPGHGGGYKTHAHRQGEFRLPGEQLGRAGVGEAGLQRLAVAQAPLLVVSEQCIEEGQPLPPRPPPPHLQVPPPGCVGRQADPGPLLHDP